MIYPIVIYGSQTLRNKSVDITPDYPELKKLIDDMFLTLTEASGVGLAAPQRQPVVMETEPMEFARITMLSTKVAWCCIQW